jgi:cytochrome o ubiquinol oxidase operon protein cyoD
MNERVIDEQQQPDQAREAQRELRSYLWGISLALATTLPPFALVYWSALPRFWLLVAIGGFAVAQIVVHFRFFLHIDLSKQKREDLQLILFSVLILMLMGGGALWIMANLALRMNGHAGP